jgi:hypothetical protein
VGLGLGLGLGGIGVRFEILYRESRCVCAQQFEIVIITIIISGGNGVR